MSKSRRPSSIDPSATSSTTSTSNKKSSKPSHTSSSSTSTADFLKQDDILQAVLFADSFTVTLRPVTLQQPKVLLPLLNTTLLDYALEFLIGGGVQELFVFCSAHADKVREHVGKSRLLKRSACQWRVIVGKGVHSEGDALRHLDQLDLIKGDFVLMSGDIVTNLSLPAVLQQHRARAQRDKSMLMSLVLKQVNRSDNAAAGGVRSLDDDSVIGLVPSTGQLLLYHNKWSEPSVELHSDIFTRHPCVQYRYDLYDTHIMICTPAVLMLIQDNFDYQSIRRDFIPGILGQEDILDKTIYAAVLSDDAYAVHVGDLHTYAAVSREIIHRWSYPYVPDLNIIGESTYRYERGNRYREEGVTVARDATVGEDTVLGRGSVLAEGCAVRRTVVGRDCSIGTRSKVFGSFVWSGVTIGANCTVDCAILCDGVTLGSNVRVERGATLSYGVEIADGQVVLAGGKVTRAEREDDVFEDSPHPEDKEAGKEMSDEAAVGKGGKGRLYVEEETEEEDDDEDVRYKGVGAIINSIAVDMERFNEMYKRKRQAEVDNESDDEWDIDENEAEADDEDDDEQTALEKQGKEQAAASGPSAPHQSLNGSSTAAPSATASEEQLSRFYGEAIATLQRGHTEQLPVDAIVLEMASLKLSHDASMSEYVEACLLAMVSFVPLVGDTSTTKPSAAPLTALDHQRLAEQRRLTFSSPLPSNVTLKQLLSILKQWSPVLAKFGKHRAEQVTFLDALARLCKRWRGALLGLTGKLMLLMVEQVPLVDEEAVWQWESQYRAEHGDKDAVLLQASEFLTWLKEAEEEEEEEDDDEEDEAEEDDDS